VVPPPTAANEGGDISVDVKALVAVGTEPCDVLLDDWIKEVIQGTAVARCQTPKFQIWNVTKIH
jgi:hypothetical protein